jgi:hypothetical protein
MEDQDCFEWDLKILSFTGYSKTPKVSPKQNKLSSRDARTMGYPQVCADKTCQRTTILEPFRTTAAGHPEKNLPAFQDENVRESARAALPRLEDSNA